MARWLIVVGGLNSLIALVLSAYGAHGLPATLDEAARGSYQTAVQIQMLHGIGICLVGLSLFHLRSPLWLPLSGWALLTGVVLFCGGIYAKVLLQTTPLGVVVPWGGATLMLGWALFIGSWLRGAITPPPDR